MHMELFDIIYLKIIRKLFQLYIIKFTYINITYSKIIQ